MLEKIKSFFLSEKFEKIIKTMFNKKAITAVLTVGILAVVLNLGFHMFFEVNGVVKGINGTKVTVANFFSTRTVDVGSGVNISDIKVGDKIKITKNITGEVLTVNAGHKGRRGDFRGDFNESRGHEKGHLKEFK